MTVSTALTNLVVAGALGAFAWYDPGHGWPAMAAMAAIALLGLLTMVWELTQVREAGPHSVAADADAAQQSIGP